MSIRNPWILFAAALLPAAPAAGIGFGDIALHSRVGEPLRADVPILAEPGEEVASLCFSLAPLAGSDLPVISNAKTRLVRAGNRYLLQITGGKPIDEPIFLVGLRAGCGADLQRDYVLMPAEPVVYADARPAATDAPAPPAATAGSARKGAPAAQSWRASEGESLESIAETLVPDDLAQQRRMLAALKRANPKFAGKSAIAEGTTVAIPDLSRRIVAERDSLPEQKAEATRDIARPPAPAAPPRKTVRPAAPKAKATAPDRLLLGAPPADVAGGGAIAPAKGSRAELDERMQKLEATIQSLNTQIEALDKALALTTESIALQQKLQAAQKAAEPAAIPAPVVAPPPPAAGGGNWQEILAAAFGGGLLAAGIAYLLGRRDRRHVDGELPLAMAVPVPAHSRPGGSPPQTPPAEPSLRPGDLQADELSMDEDESAVALAEIMLSFGRPEAAAQTLARYIEEHAPDNPRPWLMLLDLYRRSRLRLEYARLAPHLKERFNLYVAPWDDAGTPAAGLKSIEDYAHVTSRVTATWGTSECADYLRGLLRETRHGERGGFPLEVVEEILLLLHTLESGYDLPAAGRRPLPTQTEGFAA